MKLKQSCAVYCATRLQMNCGGEEVHRAVSDFAFCALPVDLCEIREIRAGRNAKNFERFKDGKDKHDDNTCFTIFYGSQFVLSSLSLGGERMWRISTL